MTTAPSSRAPFSARLGQGSAGRLDAIGRSLSKSYSFHITTSQLSQPQQPEDDGTLRVSCIPIDFTLKTKFRISSPDSLSWLMKQDAKIMSRAMELFVKNEELTPSENDSDDSLAASFRATLMSWTHPDTITEESNSDRRARWEQSFHSIYYMFRQGTGEYFYVIAAKFAVLFYNATVTISRSTSEIRKDLTASNIEFSMPLMKTRDDDERVLLDVTEESALFIEGRRNVHMFFEYFINKKFLGDVPTIVSPVPFVNAAIHSPTPVFNQITSAASKTPTSGSSKLVQSHVLEYSGVLLPTQVGFLTQILRHRVESSVSIRFWTEPLSAALDQIGGQALTNIARKHGFTALLDFAKKRLESDATLTITNVSFAPTGQISVEIDSAPKPSSLSRGLSSAKII